MATTQCKPGERLHQVKSPISADEAQWQQLMVFNYLMFETIEAMAQERASGNHTPLNHHWQQFVHHLRIEKPKLGACLDNVLSDREGVQ
ncbi:MAG: hypothetical protein JKY66_05195 [Spongiibacteraceae bacterium]|nr:hypothetical protein [Spongiibacteraceae bacterium]